MALDSLENNVYSVLFENDGKFDCKLKISERQKQMLELHSQVISNFFDNDTFYIPKTVDISSFNLILKYIDLCPEDFDYNFPKPITFSSFNNKAYSFEAWLNGMKKEEIVKLLHASNYLIIPGLTNLLCAYIALKIKSMTREQVKEYFSN